MALFAETEHFIIYFSIIHDVNLNAGKGWNSLFSCRIVGEPCCVVTVCEGAGVVFKLSSLVKWEHGWEGVSGRVVVEVNGVVEMISWWGDQAGKFENWATGDRREARVRKDMRAWGPEPPERAKGNNRVFSRVLEGDRVDDVFCSVRLSICLPFHFLSTIRLL